MTSRDYLTGRLALAEGATRAPWGHWLEAGSIEIFAADPDNLNSPALAPGTTSTEWILVSDVRPRLGWGEDIYEPDEPDAAFIADARTSNPVMAAALIAVLDLHTMVEYVGANATGPVCDECSPPPGDRSIPYPCPTVRLITDALGADK